MRLTGRVKWFNNSRGRGVIQPDKGEAVPVEAAAIQGSALAGLEPGQAVEFEIAGGPRKPHADRVLPMVERRLGSPGADGATGADDAGGQPPPGRER